MCWDPSRARHGLDLLGLCGFQRHGAAQTCLFTALALALGIGALGDDLPDGLCQPASLRSEPVAINEPSSITPIGPSWLPLPLSPRRCQSGGQ